MLVVPGDCMHTVLFALALTITTQAPAASVSEATVPAPLAGVALGTLTGVVVFGGGMLAFSNHCVTTSASCPWGDDGGEIIGAIAMVPAAALFGAIVGGVAGGVTALVLEQDDVAAARVAADAREERLIALRATPPPAMPTTATTKTALPAPPHPEAAARAPDDVDDEG